MRPPAEASRGGAPAAPAAELLELTSARGFAAFAVVLFHVDHYSGPLVWLGEVSYALYLSHFLVLMAVYSVAKRLIGSQ